MPVNSMLLNIKYSSKKMIDVIATMASGDMLKNLLIAHGGELIQVPGTQQRAEIEEMPQIVWEDFKLNYIDRPSEEKEEDDEEDIIFEDDDENMRGLEMMMMGPMNAMKQVHNTPWGRFAADNPISPVNLYELKVAHLKGFKVTSIPNFEQMMANIDGVALFSKLDPYFIVIAPAKLYSIQDVKSNVERAIYKALNIEIKNEQPTLESYVAQAQSISQSKFSEEGIQNIVMVFPEPNVAVDIIENPTEKDIKEVNQLSSQLKDLIIFKNGELYEQK